MSGRMNKRRLTAINQYGPSFKNRSGNHFPVNSAFRVVVYLCLAGWLEVNLDDSLGCIKTHLEMDKSLTYWIIKNLIIWGILGYAIFAVIHYGYKP
jgi:hypothetical protein